jgi:hypothetical protein
MLRRETVEIRVAGRNEFRLKRRRDIAEGEDGVMLDGSSIGQMILRLNNLEKINEKITLM